MFHQPSEGGSCGFGQRQQRASGSAVARKCDLGPTSENVWALGAIRVHQAFGTGLSSALTFALRGRVVIEILEASITTSAALELLWRESIHVAHFQGDQDARVDVAFDRGFAFAALEQLLGGNGCGALPNRRLSNLERRVLKVIETHCQEQLARAWSDQDSLSVQQVHPEAARFIAAEHNVLVTFRTAVVEQEGTLWLAFPVAPFAPRLLRALPDDLLIETRAVLGPASISNHDLLHLQPGDLLSTSLPDDAPVSLVLDGQPLLKGAASAFRGRKAIRVIRPVPPATRPEATVVSPPKQGV